MSHVKWSRRPETSVFHHVQSIDPPSTRYPLSQMPVQHPVVTKTAVLILVDVKVRQWECNVEAQYSNAGFIVQQFCQNTNVAVKEFLNTMNQKSSNWKDLYAENLTQKFTTMPLRKKVTIGAALELVGLRIRHWQQTLGKQYDDVIEQFRHKVHDAANLFHIQMAQNCSGWRVLYAGGSINDVLSPTTLHHVQQPMVDNVQSMVEEQPTVESQPMVDSVQPTVESFYELHDAQSTKDLDQLSEKFSEKTMVHKAIDDDALAKELEDLRDRCFDQSMVIDDLTTERDMFYRHKKRLSEELRQFYKENRALKKALGRSH